MKHRYVDHGIPFLRSQNVRANAYRPEGLVFISPAFHQEILKSRLLPGDVVVVRSGNVGTACVIPDSLFEANCADLVVIQNPIAIDPWFLSFYMNSMAQTHIEAGTVGIALTHFNTESVANIPVPLPPWTEQKRIVAKVNELIALSDKLESKLTQAREKANTLMASFVNHLCNIPARLPEVRL